VGQFEGGADDSGDAGEVQGAAYHAEARETFDDSADAVAVNFGELGEVEDDAGLVFFQEVVHSEFQAFAFDAHLKRTLQFEDDDAGVELFSDDFHWEPPWCGAISALENRYWQIEQRIAELSSPGAAGTQAPATLPEEEDSSASQGNSRMARTQPLSASSRELPHPEGRKGPSFWLTGLSAWPKKRAYWPGGGATYSFTVMVKVTSSPLTHFLKEKKWSWASSSETFFWANCQSATESSGGSWNCGYWRVDVGTRAS
jgi:hypothetical protein